MFSPNTLYYFFTTVAQTLAAIAALIAVVVHFRISALRDFLVGDGEAVLKGLEEHRAGYQGIPKKYKDRLINSNHRKDIGGIKSVIQCMAEKEKDAGHTLKDRPNGFQWLLSCFLTTEDDINKMLIASKRAFIFAITTALYSIMAILLIDLASQYICFQLILVLIDLILLGFCSFHILNGMKLAFKDFINRF